MRSILFFKASLVPVLVLVVAAGLDTVRLDTDKDANEVEFPPLLDSDDIAYFFEQNDLDGLHWALSSVFARSGRIPHPPTTGHESTMQEPALPQQLIARGGGASYTTAYKLEQDLEQALYLAEHLKEKQQAEFFGNIVAPMYQEVLSHIPPLEQLNATGGLYPFSQSDQALGIGSLYNKALYQAKFDNVPVNVPLINPDLDLELIQRQWLGQDSNHKHPGIVVVDDILTPEALNKIRQLLLESTVWYQTKLPLQFGGYVGAYIDDGLHDRILLQVAFELYEKLPQIMKRHYLKYLWAYKYDSHYTGINTHADQAAINVNLWLTPDTANLDPTSGGLVIFTAKPPPDWEFEKYNTDTEFVREELLKPTGYANWTVPYRQNRAVIFDSALFHHTDDFSFRRGYKNRRINLTLLYGDMQRSPSASSGESSSSSGGKEEL
jgi:hypothetical protein